MSTSTLICSFRGCNRTFPSQDLLHRHETSHAGSGRYPCTVCAKSYTRSDVLSRHMVSQHGASPPPMGRPRKLQCTNCIAEDIACQGTAPDPCARCTEQGLGCRYDRKRRASTTPSRSQRQSTGAREQEIAPIFDFTPPDAVEPLASGFPPENDDWLTMLGLDTLPDPLDWGIEEPQGNIFEVLNTHAPNSPNWNLSHKSPPVDNQASPENLHGVPSQIPDGQPFDSPWPHIDKPLTPDSQLLLPRTQLLPNPPLTDDRLSDRTRQTMIDIVSYSHRATWPGVETSSFPSAQTLTICVNLYFRHFHEWMPVLDSAGSKIDDMAPLILMAVSAIGAMYNRDGLQVLGFALNELVRRAIYYTRESDRRFIFETKIVQSLLLQTQFAFYSGYQKAFQQAESSRAILVQACKRMHLLRPGFSAMDALGEMPHTEHQLATAQREDRLRAGLGWSIYLLDAQVACLLNLPAQLSISEIATLFPSPDNEGSQMEFSRVLAMLLSDGNLPIVVDDLGYCIISYTLYRLCMDAATVQSIFRTDHLYTKYSLAFPPHIKHHPQQLLDRIKLYTLNTHLPPSSLLISCAALAYHAHLQFSRLGFIELVKVAAGKSGTISSRLTAQEQIRVYVNRDLQGARNVFAHSALLSCLLARYVYDTPSEVVWTFDAALCIWATMRFSEAPIAVGPPFVTLTWSESPHIERWIAEGGGLAVHGLGDVASLTSNAILGYFMDRLSSLSWSLAIQYIQVLSSLKDV